MIKLIIKLAIAALIANAAWRLGSTYLAFYKFQDAVKESVLFGADKTVDQLRSRTMELASQYDLPLAEENFTINWFPATRARGRSPFISTCSVSI